MTPKYAATVDKRAVMAVTAIRSETREHLRSEIEATIGKSVRPRMTEKERDVTAWRLHRTGMSLSDVAQELGLSVRSVRNALTRVECGRYGEVA